MHTIKNSRKLLLCDYQCTSVRFIKLSNRIEISIHKRESNRIDSISSNRNALLSTRFVGEPQF